MIGVLSEIARLRWLGACAERSNRSRPVVLDPASTWKTPLDGGLLTSEGLVLLQKGASDEDPVRFADISSAKIIEDKQSRYTVEISFKDAATPQAKLTFRDSVFFMLVFAALTNAAVTCHFQFTDARLRELGAQG